MSTGNLLETIVKVNFALYALICAEGAAMYWLLPPVRFPTLLQDHPRARLLLLIAALICLIMVFVPDNHPGSSSLMRSRQIALLTPLTVVLTVLTTLALGVAVLRRLGKGRRRSELERARLARSKAPRTGQR